MSKPAVRNPKNKPSKPTRMYERFHWSQRVAHAILLTSFTLLGLTGLPQKFSQAGWAQAMIQFFGGIETTRLIHHFSAIALMLLSIYHLLDAGYKIFVRRVRLSMLPGVKDLSDALQAFLYNIGIAKKRPQMGRYTFEEKAEYWALIWGTVIMGITGFFMWNPITTTRFLPGEIIPASKAAHGGEALLAVMAIIVWHMYGVHIKRFNKAMFTGKQTEHEMLEEHPLELADIKAGVNDRPLDLKSLKKRKAVYYPVAGVLGALMLLGVYGFIIGEKTAITTVQPPPNQVPIYVPQTPTPIPTVTVPGISFENLTWDGYIGSLLQGKCSSCHGTTQAMKGLSFSSYALAMKGSADGAVILPGNSEDSILIRVQQAGGHASQLSPEEMVAIQKWIDNMALEK